MKKVLLIILLVGLVIATSGCIDAETVDKILEGLQQTQVIIQQVPREVQTQYMQYDVDLDISPNDICVGEKATGTINSNIPGGTCTIRYESGGTDYIWGTIRLDAQGNYRHTETILVTGKATFTAMCTDGMGNYRESNPDYLVVNPCGTTTTISTGKWYCCEMVFTGWRTCRSGMCMKSEKQISAYASEKLCKLYCKTGATTTTAGTTTTVSGKVLCESKWPIPRGEKDCASRFGCAKTEYCKFHKGVLGMKSFCKCIAKYTTTTTAQTTTVATTSTTTSTTTTTGASFCTDNDNTYPPGGGGPNLDSMKTYSSCVDNTGTLWDDCGAGTLVEEAICSSGTNKCMHYGLSCSGYFGAGWTCSGGKCIPP